MLPVVILHQQMPQLAPVSVRQVLTRLSVLQKHIQQELAMDLFPTEENNKIGKTLGVIGNEFGTVTGRKRRCGWLDAVMLKQAIIKSGVNSIALTKLDVLDKFIEIKICVKYEINGKFFSYLPGNEMLQKKIKPVYITLPGWNEKTFGHNDFSKLPKNAKKFIKKLEKLVNCRVDIVSTGPDHRHTIIINKAFC